MPKKAPKTTPEEAVLNLKREAFCQFYVKNSVTRGNATHSYAEAYEYRLDELPTDDAVYETDENNLRRQVQASSYDRACAVCATEGGRLLRNPDVQERIRVLLVEMLEDRIVDGELASVIMQNVELPSKMAAIREYNALRQRVKKKVELEHVVKTVIIKKHGGHRNNRSAA